MTVYYPCEICREARQWFRCQTCTTGFVKSFDEFGKWVGMKDCPDCIKNGYARLGGRLVCERCDTFTGSGVSRTREEL